MRTTSDLGQKLRSIKLSYFEDNLESFLGSFKKQSSVVHQALEQLSDAEIEFRNQRSLERRIKQSKVGRLKPMKDFDWDWPKQVDRAGIERLFNLSFIKEGKNALFVGPQGVGKTMIAKNLAHYAASSGISSLYTSASELVNSLQSAKKAGVMRTKLRGYLKVDLLIIDEIGYLSYDNKAADLLFEVVTKRYERNSIIVTTNLAFTDWDQIFPGASCVTAMIDRFTHHCEIFNIKADSYRLHEATKNKKKGEET